MQQTLLMNSQRHFHQELNALLMDGWRVVPGTFACTQLSRKANDFSDPNYTVGGVSFQAVFFVVLENDQVT